MKWNHKALFACLLLSATAIVTMLAILLCSKAPPSPMSSISAPLVEGLVTRVLDHTFSDFGDTLQSEVDKRFPDCEQRFFGAIHGQMRDLGSTRHRIVFICFTYPKGECPRELPNGVWCVDRKKIEVINDHPRLRTSSRPRPVGEAELLDCAYIHGRQESQSAKVPTGTIWMITESPRAGSAPGYEILLTHITAEYSFAHREWRVVFENTAPIAQQPQ
ncbi:MAG: hypothetical protein L6R00_19560 [Phycisphaerae bacterium]|nr:hypothetical protein [Phycisphaerae bacterium]